MGWLDTIDLFFQGLVEKTMRGRKKRGDGGKARADSLYNVAYVKSEE